MHSLDRNELERRVTRIEASLAALSCRISLMEQDGEEAEQDATQREKSPRYTSVLFIVPGERLKVSVIDVDGGDLFVEFERSYVDGRPLEPGSTKKWSYPIHREREVLIEGATEESLTVPGGVGPRARP